MFAVFTTARKLWRRSAAVVAFAALAACEPIDLSGLSNSGPNIDTNKPIPVALLVPVGSGNSGDEVLAKSLENAARLAIADLEGVTIDLRVYATAGNPATAGARAQQAVDDGAKIILGPVYAASANAAGVAVADDGVNVLAFSNNPEIAGGNVFVMGPTFDNTARRLIGYAASKGKSRIVAVHSADVAGQLGLSAIQKAAAGSSAQVVATVPYQLSQQGVVEAVPQVKSAVSSAGANAVFMTSTTAGALPLFSQLLPEAGVSSQMIGLTRWDIPRATLDLPGLQGGWFALPDPNRTTAFNTRYSSTYGGAPHPIGALAFDGIAAIGALAAQGKRDALTGKALTQSAGFQGATGVFRLRADGTNDRGMSVATIQGGQVTIVDPAPSSFAGF